MPSEELLLLIGRLDAKLDQLLTRHDEHGRNLKDLEDEVQELSLRIIELESMARLVRVLGLPIPIAIAAAVTWLVEKFLR
jgi:hypothetical protein